MFMIAWGLGMGWVLLTSEFRILTFCDRVGCVRVVVCLRFRF